MPWLELRIIATREQVAPIEQCLEGVGALSVTLQDHADHPIYEPALGETPLWQTTRVTGLFEADADTSGIEAQLKLPPTCHVQWQILEDKDWEREWMRHYAPIQCADNLWICPSWITPPNPAAVNLLLDPGLAFGTGTHPTTFLCLQWLAQQDLSGCAVVDYGCGSGILGIASLLLGAQQAIGIDLDPQALLATADNAQRNGLALERFPVCLPEQAPTISADLVLANILAGPLVQLAPKLVDSLKAKGSICLSGILANQASMVQAAYQDKIDFDPVHSLNGWVCLTGRKR